MLNDEELIAEVEEKLLGEPRIEGLRSRVEGDELIMEYTLVLRRPAEYIRMDIKP